MDNNFFFISSISNLLLEDRTLFNTILKQKCITLPPSNIKILDIYNMLLFLLGKYIPYYTHKTPPSFDLDGLQILYNVLFPNKNEFKEPDAQKKEKYNEYIKRQKHFNNTYNKSAIIPDLYEFFI